MNGKEWITALNSVQAEKLFTSLYGAGEIEKERNRYAKLIEEFLREDIFPKKDFPETKNEVRIFTASGRTELGGNHTDHNFGKVLAASVQLDALAVVAPRQDNKILFRSTGFPDVLVDITDTSIKENEKGTTEALIRGVANGFIDRNISIHGWTANASSTVLTGSGLSSSAALEILVGKIFDGLYNNNSLSAITLAKIAQKAENLYYGKPSGLMDQVASALGGAAFIDFAESEPKVNQVRFDPEYAGYVLCVVNTGGSHADLTQDYGSIPEEMRSLSAFFSASNLRSTGEEIFMKTFTDSNQIQSLRKQCGDRAILRSIHFFNENKRVDKMCETLEKLNSLLPHSTEEITDTFNTFLKLVNESGNSSWELLQNISPPHNPKEQGLALGLSLTRLFAGEKNIACRVHGGGFAGTIQAYIPKELFAEYKTFMETVFGFGTVTKLKIRSIGTSEIVF